MIISFFIGAALGALVGFVATLIMASLWMLKFEPQRPEWYEQPTTL